jgi:hypothetical protein
LHSNHSEANIRLSTRNSKLTLAESVQFDREFSINEFDVAVQQLNEHSAGGSDGIGTKFLKKYWQYLRHPLFKYATTCFAEKKLTQSCTSATIKLIPKKGDTSKIKNWRPNSLLNSVFKIISKTIDNRLEKINDIILSRSQKGFVTKR